MVESAKGEEKKAKDEMGGEKRKGMDSSQRGRERWGAEARENGGRVQQRGEERKERREGSLNSVVYTRDN